MKAAATTALVGLLLLTACGGSAGAPSPAGGTSSPPTTASPTTSGPVDLTGEAAAARYLDAVCPANGARLAYDEAQEAYEADSTPDDAPQPQTQEAATAAAEAITEGAQTLVDPGYVWPAEVSDAIGDVAEDMTASAEHYASIAAANTWAEVGPWPEALHPDAGAQVRLGLDLPPQGQCP